MIAGITSDAKDTKTSKFTFEQLTIEIHQNSFWISDTKNMKTIENTSASNSETRNTETFKNKIEKIHVYL